MKNALRQKCNIMLQKSDKMEISARSLNFVSLAIKTLKVRRKKISIVKAEETIVFEKLTFESSHFIPMVYWILKLPPITPGQLLGRLHIMTQLLLFISIFTRGQPPAPTRCTRSRSVMGSGHLLRVVLLG